MPEYKQAITNVISTIEGEIKSKLGGLILSNEVDLDFEQLIVKGDFSDLENPDKAFDCTVAICIIQIGRSGLKVIPTGKTPYGIKVSAEEGYDLTRINKLNLKPTIL